MVIDIGSRAERRAPFRVLVVTGRATSRGPAVQRLLRSHLEAGGRAGDILLGAAGTCAAVGEPLDPQTARALVELDADASGYTARQVTERRLAQADLVLTADRAGREHVAHVWPQASGRTFTMLEFVRLAAAAGPAASPSELVTGMRRAARRQGGVPPHEDDLPALDSPDYADHRRAVLMLDDVSRKIARALTACVPAQAAPSSA